MRHLELSAQSRKNIKQTVEFILKDLRAEMIASGLTNLKVSIDITQDKSVPMYGIKIDYSKYEAGQICYDKKEGEV